MSRGISLNVKLVEEENTTLVYDVFASGWGGLQPFTDRKVGELTLSSTDKKLQFVPKGEWADEIFYFPAFEEFQSQNFELPDLQLLNKNFRMWNYHLIRAIRRLLTDPKYKKKVWFYH